jgi:hypothetical protein
MARTAGEEVADSEEELNAGARFEVVLAADECSTSHNPHRSQ